MPDGDMALSAGNGSASFRYLELAKPKLIAGEYARATSWIERAVTRHRVLE